MNPFDRIYCPSCRSEVRQTDAFCPRCGASLSTNSETQPPTRQSSSKQFNLTFIGIALLALIVVGIIMLLRPKNNPQSSGNDAGLTASKGNQQKSEAEIVREFKESVAQHVSWMNISKRIYGQLHVACKPDFSIDVKKTDSLVSPYMGTAQIVYILAASDPHPVLEKHTHYYAYQEGRWLLKSGTNETLTHFNPSEIYKCGGTESFCPAFYKPGQ